MAKGEYLVYIGTAIYTGQPSRNIYGFRLNMSTGELVSLGVSGEAENPNFLAAHPSGKYLYAVSSAGDVKAGTGGRASAFQINRKTGKLHFINRVTTHGAHPSYVTVDSTGRFVVTANYYGGTVESHPVRKNGAIGEAASVAKHTGPLGPDRVRQEASHPHSVIMSPDNRFAVSADLGLDRVFVHRFDAKTGALTPNDSPAAATPPGAGPRHPAFTPDGKFAYSMNELQSTVTVFAFEASTGAMTLLQTISTLPKDYKGEKSGAEIKVSPSGKFLYTSNRGHDSIAVFAINPAKGTLTPVEHVPTQGKTPRNFALDPTGSFLIVANQDSNNLVVFRVNRETGRLTPTGHVAEVTAPTCVTYVA